MSGITVKIFMGLAKSYELKQALNKSISYKNTQLSSSKTLIDIENQGKEYVGFLLDNPLSYMQILQKELKLRSEILSHCPTLNIDSLPCVLFSQVFIA